MGDRVDVVVVGAGVAGLIAAAKVATAGRRVVVVDPHPIGGRARSSSQQGFTLNLGPHALYDAGAFRRTLTELGITPSGRAPEVGGAHGVLDGRLAPLPGDLRSMVSTKLVGPRGKVGLAALMARLSRMDVAELVGRSVGEWLDGQPAEVRAVVEMYIRLSSYTDAPELFDAGAALGQIRLGGRGVLYVDGGWQSLVDALRAVIAERGGEVREGFEVTGVTADRSGAIVVGAGGEELAARAVVLAAGGPSTAARLTGIAVPGADRLGPPVEAACLDLGTTATPVAQVVLGVDEPLYLSVHAPVARLAPRGEKLVTVMKYLSPGVAPSPAGIVRGELVAHAARAGIERREVVLERFLRAATVHHGVPLACHGGLAGRPAVDAFVAAGLTGVFLAGDWVGPEGMLSDASAASGVDAARRALRECAIVAA